MAEISIENSKISSLARQQLSIIGKHHKSPTGGTLFATTTLSEIEVGVMPTLIVGAAQVIVGELSPIVTAYGSDNTKLTFDIEKSRWGDALPSAFADNIKMYIVANVVQSVLNMSVPDIAPKYTSDAQLLLASLVKMAFVKKPPGTSVTVYNVSGTVTIEDNEKTDGYNKDNKTT